MKKKLIQAVTFVAVFLIAMLVINRIMNQDTDNLTMEMPGATYPTISITKAGYRFNTMFGNKTPLEVAFVRDNLSVLDENRELDFCINTYGTPLSNVGYEVRSAVGDNLIENGTVTDLELSGAVLEGKIVLKDLYEKNQEYVIAILLSTRDNETLYYYTRAVWGTDYHEFEKLEFVQDFHNRLYDVEEARELTKYLEPKASLADNSTFHKVDIHSNFKQVTWGDLEIEEIGTPSYTFTDLSNQTATILVDYYVRHTSGEDQETDYRVEELYRVRYTPDRMYLLDYRRTTDQMPNEKQLFVNDKVILGITDEKVDMLESEDGNVLAFLICNRLFTYNNTNNRLVNVFGFAKTGMTDERNLNQNHSIKIFDVDEAGNVLYGVYGYMNRGTHQGETGIWVRSYDSATNTSKERLFIPVTKPYGVIKEELEKLFYVNADEKLFFLLEGNIYEAALDREGYSVLGTEGEKGNLYISQEQKVVIWQKGHKELIAQNLGRAGQTILAAKAGEQLQALGFMGEDIIYGVAKDEDVETDKAGELFFPMYKLVICDYNGNILKEYENEGIYITDCTVDKNQITLKRVSRNDKGIYVTALDDHITSNEKQKTGKNEVSVPTIDIYEKYVQIRLKKAADVQTLRILNPKDVIFEGGNRLELTTQYKLLHRYYVFAGDGLMGIYADAGEAVSEAYNASGLVTDETGTVVWRKAVRQAKNQIMAIKEPEKNPDNTLAVCLDTIFGFSGIVRSAQSLLDKGQSVTTILQDAFPEYQALNLKGSPLDSVLYYVNRDIPVLAIVDNQAVLITGFNDLNVVIFEPSTGKLYKKGMKDSKAWFEEYGNRFYTYNK